MADRIPLLSDELTDSQKLNLANMKQHPGFPVLEKMFMDACKRATEKVIQLDPAEEGYERKLRVPPVCRQRAKSILSSSSSVYRVADARHAR